MASRLLQAAPSRGALASMASVVAESSTRTRVAIIASDTFFTTCTRPHFRPYTSTAVTSATKGFSGSGGHGGAESLFGIPEVIMATILGVGTTTSFAASVQVASEEEHVIAEPSFQYGPTVGPLPPVEASVAPTAALDTGRWDANVRTINAKSTANRWKRIVPLKRPRTSATEHNDSPDVYNASVGALQGLRPFMEDEYCIGDSGKFVAVFDGHGGSGVSSLLKDKLYASFSKFLQDKEPSAASRVSALRSAFDEVGQEVLEHDELQFQGSTAVAVILSEQEDGTRTLVSANVGDSRAVLSRSGRAVSLTKDHKPTDALERHRILSMGGTIQEDKNGGPARVRNLAISRSIGDRFAKPVVTGEPDIMQLPIFEDGDEFVILASDGLWDVMTNQEVVSFVHEKLDASKDTKSRESLKKKLSSQLAYEAISRGTSDNVCVALVWLQ